MSEHKEKIMVCGMGSIGERHFKILENKLGLRPFAVRSRGRPLRTLTSVEAFNTIEEGLGQKPKAALICNPTSLHIDTALKIAEQGIPIFIEKPLSHNLHKTDQLKTLVKQKNLVCMVGYMMRFHPLLIKLRDIILSKKYGEVASYRSRWGEYLPAWHPWEDYKESYAAKADLGGGACLTLSHDIDLLLWFFGNVKLREREDSPGSILGIDVEEETSLSFIVNDSAPAKVELSYLDNPPQRFILVKFTDAIVYFDYYTSTLKITPTAKTEFTEQVKNFNRDLLFESELRHFIGSITNRTKVSPSLIDGINVLKLIEQSKDYLTPHKKN